MAVMPQGVEHIQVIAVYRMKETVAMAVMPQGVEHLRDMLDRVAPGRSDGRDAARR